jgi:hypothetical protein
MERKPPLNSRQTRGNTTEKKTNKPTAEDAEDAEERRTDKEGD